MARRLQSLACPRPPERMEACCSLIPGRIAGSSMESGDAVSAGGLRGALTQRRAPIFRIAVDRMARSFPKNPRLEAVTTTLDLDVPAERA